jgi:flagellar biosynthesis protein
MKLMEEHSAKKKAVALRYDRKKDDAPTVVAKGQGKIAQKIIDLAKAHDIPIKDDPDLIEVLASLDIDQEIPSEIYVAVAELLAFVYSANEKKPD